MFQLIKFPLKNMGNGISRGPKNNTSLASRAFDAPFPFASSAYPEGKTTLRPWPLPRFIGGHFLNLPKRGNMFPKTFVARMFLKCFPVLPQGSHCSKKQNIYMFLPCSRNTFCFFDTMLPVWQHWKNIGETCVRCKRFWNIFPCFAEMQSPESRLNIGSNP